MPKKKPIDKRLKNLFEDVKPEQTPAEFKPAPTKRASEEKRLQSSEAKPVTVERRTSEMTSPDFVCSIPGIPGWSKFMGNVAGRG